MKKIPLLIAICLFMNIGMTAYVQAEEAPEEQKGYVWLEGETGNSTGDYTVKALPMASGGQALVVDSVDDTKTHEVSYSFEAPSESQYDIWILSTPGNASWASKLKWKLDGAAYQAVTPTATSPAVYTTNDYRKVPLAWYKLGAVNIGDGTHDLHFLVDGKRTLDQSMILNYLDVVSIVPTAWEWSPAGLVEPTEPEAPPETPSEDLAYVWLEGEAGDSTGDYMAKSLPAASGGKALIVDSTDDQKTHSAAYSFDSPGAGSYDIWILSTPGNVNWASKYKWKLDEAAYQYAAPIAQSPNIYNTNDYRNVPLAWYKLGIKNIGEGNHTLSFLIDGLRSLDQSMILNYIDAIAVVPTEWGFIPDSLSKPFDPMELKLDYVSGAVNSTVAERGSSVAVEVTSKLTEAVNFNVTLKAELIWKGEVVSRVEQLPQVPMSGRTVNQEYSDELMVPLPFNAPESQLEIRVGIVNSAFQQGEYVTVGTVQVGSQQPIVEHLSASAQSLVISSLEEPSEFSAGTVSIDIHQAVDFDARAYVSFWKNGLLWAVAEAAEAIPTSSWSSNEAHLVNFQFRVPEEINEGNYEAQFGLHRIETAFSAGSRADVIIPEKETSYKPMSHGIFKDHIGQSHFWYVTQNNVMVWDGEPFIPIGGMFTSKYLINFNINQPAKNEENWQYDLAVLEQMRIGGVKDVYVNSVVVGTDVPVWAWQYLLDYFEEHDMTYGIQLNGTLRRELVSDVVRANANDAAFKQDGITENGPVSMTINGTDLNRYLERVISTRFIVIHTDSGAVVQTGTGSVQQVSGSQYRLSAEVMLPEGGNGSYEIRFLPKITTIGKSGSLHDLWDSADDIVNKISGHVERFEVGPHFRMFVDPHANEANIVNGDEKLRVDSVKYNLGFQAWLEQKYDSINQLNDAWEMITPLSSFELASQLVPILMRETDIQEAQNIYLLSSQSDQVYIADGYSGNLWDDNLMYREDSYAAFNNRIADSIKQSINVPVVYKYTAAMKRLFVNSEVSSSGYDGLGGEIYGHGFTVHEKSGYSYSAVKQSAKTLWLFTTETQLEENVALKASTGEVGYPDKATMFANFDTLFEAGHKGVYDFLFHAPHDANLRDYYSYTAKPIQFDWLREYREQMLSAEHVDEIVNQQPSDIYYSYPGGQTWWWNPNQRTAVLPGDDYNGAGTLRSNDNKWVLPTFDLNVPAPVVIINLEDAPATTVWGKPLNEIVSLTNWNKKIVYMGLRKNLGQIAKLDHYFTPEIIELDNGDQVQVLQPSATSEVIFQTEEGKVWGLRDGNLWIISNQNWHTTTTIHFIDGIGLHEQPSVGWIDGALNASNVSQTEVTLQWSGASNAAGVTSYRIDQNGSVGQQIDKRTLTVTDAVYSYTVTGLSPNTQYEFTVQAGNKAGEWSLDGPSITVTTTVESEQSPEEKPIGNVGNPTAAHIKPSAVEIARDRAQQLAAQGIAGAGKLKLAGQMYELKPTAGEASEAWSEPVSITISYDQTGLDEELLGIYYLNEASGKWEYAGGVIDRIQHQFTYSAERPGIYSVMELDRSFDDIPSGHWAERAVKVLAAMHVVNGVDDRHFMPTGKTTRAEFAALLIRALGLKGEGDSSFPDIPSNAWYASEVAIAFKAGIVNGDATGQFNPNAQVSREQMAIMVVRAYEYWKGIQARENQAIDGFKDGDQISSWASDSISKVLALGLMTGRSGERFAPKDEALRSETAMVVWSLLNALKQQK
ncbi:hypothetical protein BK133_00130 [Paenibacillus sp. FSL H8-0548]|uniref:S-layer homology domain-containing protein n=1 Tax=Paenibacillus sp. FSL H8-0548 TaxID=1920422 RepID=UPI00096F484C|nr:S-layer homology domain-containing protein [Paenibacillus sp. FSL H8-0548]OMF38654.1 hypothetical protein BK133_00130 [Paenibacillus sp. FSL H8-0548]